MIDKQVRMGFDRFLALEWANYSLELFHSSASLDEGYSLLKSYLQEEIPGIESARKTANQLKRLWLFRDACSPLREKTITLHQMVTLQEKPILHFGIAVNVFPLFRDVCYVIGSQVQLSGGISRKQIQERILEKYGNPVTIPRATDRVAQTLEDWGFILTINGVCTVKQMRVDNLQVSHWLVIALLNIQVGNRMPLRDFVTLPILLGIDVGDIRNIIRQSNDLLLENTPDSEVIRNVE